MHKHKVPENCSRCPETTRLVESVPGLKTALFSIHAPGVHIPRHKGATKGMVTCHLALVVPKEREKCRMAVHDQMIEQGRGHVVNLSSIYSNFPVAGAAVYGASKAAVNFLSEALRVESQGKIKVTNVRPTGVPATGLASAVVNQQAIIGILGQNAPTYLQQMQAHMAGELPPEATDVENIEYYALAPEYLAEQIVYAINQPWGVSIGDITVRASGDGYIL